MHGSKGGAESWEFSLSSWVGAFVYCSVACCGETALKLGSGDKHLRYALNKLSTGLLFQSCLHHKHFFDVFGLFGWPESLVAAGGGSLGGRVGFQAV